MNPPNLPMFKGGTKPFFGDYIDVQGPAFVKKNGKWVFNTDFTPAPIFHAVWTSNEDVKAPADGKWDRYAPINVNGKSLFDPLATVEACTESTAMYAASRNQNIYTARITEGLLVSTPQNTKPLSASFVRSFVIAATNATGAPKKVTFSFAAPNGVSASFQALPGETLANLPTVTADIAPHSTVSRSLFVKSSSATATLTATVTEVGGALASGFVLLNPPGTIPGLVAPDGSAAIGTSETYTPIQVAANLSNANLSNANLSNANLSNANLSNANLSNANLSNANLSNANLSNAALANLSNANLSNANLSNANLSNANLSNANLSNANLSNANLSNASLSDLNYEFQNTGNTSTSYAIKIVGAKPAPGEVLQLILARTYTTPTAVGCEIKEEPHNHILASIDDVSQAVVPDTDPVNPGVGDPSVANATLILAPGEKAQITLRGNVTLQRMAEIGTTLTPFPLPQRTPIGGALGNTRYNNFKRTIFTWTTIDYDPATGAFSANVWDDYTGVTAGSVTFVANGTIMLGTLPVDSSGATSSFIPSGLPSGATVVAFYSGAFDWLPSSATATSPAVALAIDPPSVTLPYGGFQRFHATVTGTTDDRVTWSVDETGGGNIGNDGDGFYTAPSQAGTYTVRARSRFDLTRTATATVTVTAPAPVITVTLTAPTPAIVNGQQGVLTVAVGGTTNKAVTWTVTAGAVGATVTSATPASTSATFLARDVGSYTVRATSNQDANVFAETTFSVGDAGTPVQPTLGTSGVYQVGVVANQRIAQVVAGWYGGTFQGIRVPMACAAGTQLTVEVQEVTNGVPNGMVRAGGRKVIANAQPLLPDFHATIDGFQAIYFDASVAAWPPFAVVFSAVAGTPGNACGIVAGPPGNAYAGGDAFYDDVTATHWMPVGAGVFDIPFEVMMSAPGLTVIGGDLSGSFQNVDVYYNGVPQSEGVTIRVSDASAPGTNYVDLGLAGNGYYNGALPTTVPPGGTIVMSVSRGFEHVVGTAIVPGQPSAISPNNDTLQVSLLDPIRVTWISATNPHAFKVSAQWNELIGGVPAGYGRFAYVPGGIATREYVIPAGTYGYIGASNWEARVYNYNYGSFTGPCNGCTMPLRASAPVEINLINVVPPPVP